MFRALSGISHSIKWNKWGASPPLDAVSFTASSGIGRLTSVQSKFKHYICQPGEFKCIAGIQLTCKTFGKFTRTVHSLGGSSDDTIYALATPLGKGAIAVIRISGLAAAHVLSSFTAKKELPTPRRATVRALIDPNTNETLDNAVVIWFPGPASYTGEDTAELHVHGGAAVVDGILSSLAAQSSLRLASPGEFTRRALLNGKLDLIEAEGLADLLLVRALDLKRAFPS